MEAAQLYLFLLFMFHCRTSEMPCLFRGPFCPLCLNPKIGGNLTKASCKDSLP